MQTHQIKPNRWSCSITAAAMVLRTPVAQLLERLGHDGSEIVFPELPDPARRRGFHSQELIHIAWYLGYTVTPMELFPMIAPSEGTGSIPVIFEGDQNNNWKRFIDIINNSEGIIEGRGKTWRHTVAYFNGMIYDPDGGPIYGFSQEACTEHDFYPQRALIFLDR